MLPFVQNISNQPNSLPPGASPQQVPGGSSNLLPNLMQIHPQMGFVNPQSPMPFNNPNTNFGNFNALQNNNGHLGNSVLGSAPLINPQQVQSHPGFNPQNFGHNFNLSPFPAQNLNQGNPGQFFGHNPLNVSQQLNQVSGFQNGQFGWQNTLQSSMNQGGNMPLLNPSQVVALAAQLMGATTNQVAQAMFPQNTAFTGNPQLGGLVQPNGFVPQTNFNQQVPLAPQQQMPIVSLTPSNPASSQHSQSLSLQGSHGNKHGIHDSNSNHHQSKNFMKNPKREPPNRRFQKSQDHQMHNMKGKDNFSNENEVKGGITGSGPYNSANQPKSAKRRSLAMFYTEKEIEQWREARKKNFPSKVNMEKKLAHKQANANAADEESKLRRQQLKEILAKQVELGFEVPEIPSHYLVDSEDQPRGGERNKNPLNNGRFQNRFNNKRGRFDPNNRFPTKRGAEDKAPFRKHERFAKKQRVVEGDDNSSKTPLSKMRKPTLLQKLLSTDIKRDKSRLLQALRFMVMNSFFKDWPEKQPLRFPEVIVKEAGVESEVIEEDKSSSLKGEFGGNCEVHDASDDSDGENGGCEEEGEITD